LALAGGVQALIHPGIQASFCKAGLLSPEGICRSIDADADGYVRSEGAGAVPLKPLRAAVEDGDPIATVMDQPANAALKPMRLAELSVIFDASASSGLHSQIVVC